MDDQTVGTVYFEEAVERVRLRVRADREGRPPDVALMLKTIDDRFVDPGFDVNELKRRTSPTAATMRAFKRELRCTPGVYLKRCRLQAADLALAATTDLELTVVEAARLSGYTNSRSFAHAFRECIGRRPSQGRRPVDVRETLPAHVLEGARAAPFRRLLTGDVGPEEARETVGRLRLRLCVGTRALPEHGRVHLSYADDPEARWVAEGVWAVARELPPRQRRALLCEIVRFDSPALFELLGAEAREATTRGEVAEGVALAELALEVVEEHGSGFGDVAHDLRALAWARLGEARCRAGDLAGTEQAFRFAREAWQAPRARRVAAVELELRWLESSLRLAQHRFDDACALVDETIDRLRDLDHDPHLLARALTRRALVAERRGDEPEAAAELLREAEAVIDHEASPALALVTRLHLAQAALDAGRGAEAEALLPRARALGRRVGDGGVRVWLIHVEALVHYQQGRFAEAEELLLRSREAFLERGELASAALTSFDLVRLHDRARDEPRMREAIAETVPLVESLAVQPQSLAALRMLRAVETDEHPAPPELLERIRESIAACARPVDHPKGENR